MHGRGAGTVRGGAAWRGARFGAGAWLLVAVLGGCATPGDVRKVQEEARVTHAMVLKLGETAGELRREAVQLRRQLETMRDELAIAAREQSARQDAALEVARKRIESAEARVETLAGAIRGVEMSVGGLADQVARLEALPDSPSRARRDSRAPRPGPRPGAAATVPPEDLFNRALESFNSGELGQAILDFEEFLGKHGSHALAGAARFWIGEAYYAARDYQHAAVEYRKAVDVAPKGEKTPEALLKMGLAYRALRRHDRAREAWAQLIRDFPQSEAAQRARVALREPSAAGRAAQPGDR